MKFSLRFTDELTLDFPKRADVLDFTVHSNLHHEWNLLPPISHGNGLWAVCYARKMIVNTISINVWLFCSALHSSAHNSIQKPLEIIVLVNEIYETSNWILLLNSTRNTELTKFLLMSYRVFRWPSSANYANSA